MRQLTHCRTFEVVAGTSAAGLLAQIAAVLNAYPRGREPVLLAINVMFDGEDGANLGGYRAHVTVESDDA